MTPLRASSGGIAPYHKKGERHAICNSAGQQGSICRLAPNHYCISICGLLLKKHVYNVGLGLASEREKRDGLSFMVQ